jgi:hypothetical protein
MALERVEVAPGRFVKMTPEDAKAHRAKKSAKPADKSKAVEDRPKVITSRRAEPAKGPAPKRSAK